VPKPVAEITRRAFLKEQCHAMNIFLKVLEFEQSFLSERNFCLSFRVENQK
jgi:hypothetical protein